MNASQEQFYEVKKEKRDMTIDEEKIREAAEGEADERLK